MDDYKHTVIEHEEYHNNEKKECVFCEPYTFYTKKSRYLCLLCKSKASKCPWCENWIRGGSYVSCLDCYLK